MVTWSNLGKLDGWVVNRYLALLRRFGGKDFSIEEARRALEAENLSLENVNKLIAELRKHDLIEIKIDPSDPKRRLYRLKNPQIAETTRALKGRDVLFRLLKECADIIRTAVDYKVLLLFLFYKAVSDKWEKLVEQYKREGYDEESAKIVANEDYIRLYDETENKSYSWHGIIREYNIREMANALVKISEMNSDPNHPPVLKGLDRLVDRVGLRELAESEKIFILEEIIKRFNNYDFSEVDYDLLGEAYQWILHYFAPAHAKEGEVYTPTCVIKLLIRLLNIDKGKVLDPACGSGAMLVEAYRHAKGNVELYGQDYNEVTATIARMFLALNGIKVYEIYDGDSLANPQFGEADYVVANPPWNQDRDVKSLEERKDIYEFGIPPKTTMDWAWVQLMLHFAKKKVGIVLDQGALFRSGKEAKIREDIVKNDLIEAIILLPEKLFYNTGAAGIIIILNKKKPGDRKGKILFINASNEFVKHPEVKKLNILSDENIDKIVKAYERFEDIEGFARVVSLDEIERNGYNLNVTNYVMPIVEEEEINLEKEISELRRLEEMRTDLLERVENYVEEITRVM